MRVLIGLMVLAIAGPAFGDIVYLDDDFDDGSGGGSWDGWTAYSNDGTQDEWGHMGTPVLRNSSGIHGWNPPVSPPWGVGRELGGASVYHGNEPNPYGYAGIRKSFLDDYMPNETKFFEVTLRAISSDYEGHILDGFDVYLGVDTSGGTDRTAASVEWTKIADSPNWDTFTVTRPCEPMFETIFIEARWTFLNGYNVFDIDHVKVWQTPEPAALLLCLLGLPMLRRRR